MNNTPVDQSTASTPRRHHAFTLIELLVVIAIITILAGLLLSAMQPALNSANKTTAKNQATQIAGAISAYEAEYGRLPSNGASANFGLTLVTILCTSNDAVNNPRGIIFLEATTWKKGKGGTNPNGFCDPFNSASVYSVALDTNYANSISVPYQSNSGATITQTNITKHIGVWTVWTNGTQTYLIDSWD